MGKRANLGRFCFFCSSVAGSSWTRSKLDVDERRRPDSQPPLAPARSRLPACWSVGCGRQRRGRVAGRRVFAPVCREVSSGGIQSARGQRDDGPLGLRATSRFAQELDPLLPYVVCRTRSEQGGGSGRCGGERLEESRRGFRVPKSDWREGKDKPAKRFSDVFTGVLSSRRHPPLVRTLFAPSSQLVRLFGVDAPTGQSGARCWPMLVQSHPIWTDIGPGLHRCWPLLTTFGRSCLDLGPMLTPELVSIGAVPSGAPGSVCAGRSWCM